MTAGFSGRHIYTRICPASPQDLAPSYYPTLLDHCPLNFVKLPQVTLQIPGALHPYTFFYIQIYGDTKRAPCWSRMISRRAAKRTVAVAVATATDSLANAQITWAPKIMLLPYMAHSRIVFCPREPRVNFGKCKKHSRARGKSADCILRSMKSECIAPWFTELFGVAKNETWRRDGCTKFQTIRCRRCCSF